MRPPRHLPGPRSLAAALVAALCLLASAAPAEESNSFVYRPPDRPPKGTRSHYIESPPDWLLDQIAAHLRQEGFAIEARDPTQRILVARYSGSPREFVDCGIVQMLVDGTGAEPPKQYSANRSETRTYRLQQGQRVGLLRELQLDARLAVQAVPEGKGARVTTDAIYVLTKMVSRVYGGGEPGGVLDREVMSFSSSKIGRFKKGTSCVATGRLEDLPVLAFKKTAS